MKLTPIKLGKIAEITSSKRIYMGDYTNYGIPFYRSKEIIDLFNHSTIQNTLYISEQKYEVIKSRFGVPQKGDLLLTSVGTVGIPYLVENDEKFYFKDGNLTWFRYFSTEVKSEFLFYLLQSSNIKKHLINYSKGSSQSALTIETLKEIELVFPPIKYQEITVSILSAYDNLIDTSRRRIQLLEEAARLLFREWFVHFRFPGHEKVKIVDDVPEGWEKLQVKDIIRTVNSRKKIQKSEYNKAGLYPCVDQSQEYISGYTDRKDYIINNTIPIVIFGDHTRIIKYVDFPFVSGADGTQLLVSKHKKINSEFLYFILKNINLTNYFYARHFKFLKDQRVLIPSENFCLSFSQFSKNIMKQISMLRSQNQKLAQARDLLLPRLMNGTIEV